MKAVNALLKEFERMTYLSRMNETERNFLKKIRRYRMVRFGRRVLLALGSAALMGLAAYVMTLFSVNFLWMLF